MSAFFGIPLSQKGAPNGVATLDGSGSVVQPTAGLAAETAARVAADAALDTRLDDLEALGPLATAAGLAGEVTDRASADSALDVRLAALEALGPLATDTELAGEAASRASADVNLDTRLGVIEALGPLATASSLATETSARQAAVQAVLYRLAALPELLIFGSGLTYDAVTDVLTDAPVVWPDGDTGVYHATSFSASGVDAYTITKVNGATTVTFTQPALTRNASGQVTTRPAITVS